MAAALLYGTGGDVLVAVTWIWASIATILYALRAFNASREPSTERRSFFGIRWDFVWVTLGYIAALIAEIATTISLDHGHRAVTDLDAISTLILGGLVANCSAIFGMTLGRFAVIALLVSLHGTSEVFVKAEKFLYAIGIIQFVVNMVQVGLTVYQCDPVRKLWNPMTVAGTCNLITATRKFGYFSGSVGCLADFVLAIYPAVFIVGPLQQMKRSLKIAIGFIMGGGVVAGIAGVVKTVELSNIEHLQGDYARVVVWILTETWFIIIFGSISTIRPALISIGRSIRRMTGRLTSRSRSPQTPNESSSGSGLKGNRNTLDRDQKHKSVSKTQPDEDEIALTEMGASNKPSGHMIDEEMELYKQASMVDVPRLNPR